MSVERLIENGFQDLWILVRNYGRASQQANNLLATNSKANTNNVELVIC
jgi:hypothetical protein